MVHINYKTQCSSIIRKYSVDKNKSKNHSYNMNGITEFFTNYDNNDNNYEDFYNEYVIGKEFSEHWWIFVLAIYHNKYDLSSEQELDANDTFYVGFINKIFNGFKKGEIITNYDILYALINKHNIYISNQYDWFYKNIENGFVVEKKFIAGINKYNSLKTELELTTISPTKKGEGFESKMFIQKLFKQAYNDPHIIEKFINKYIANKPESIKKFIHLTENYLIERLTKHKYMYQNLIFIIINFICKEPSANSNLIYIIFLYQYQQGRLRIWNQADNLPEEYYNKLIAKLDKNNQLIDFEIIFKEEYKELIKNKLALFDFIIEKNFKQFKQFTFETILSIFSTYDKNLHAKLNKIFSMESIKFLTKSPDITSRYVENLLLLPIDKLSEDIITIIKSDKKYLTENIFRKAIISNNKYIIEYFINNKFIVDKQHLILVNSIEMLQVFKKNNFYLDFDSYRELVRTKKMSIEQLKSYSIYENDDEEFNKIKSQLELNELEKLISCDNTYNLIKLIEYLDVNTPLITIDMIIYQSTNATRQILYEYYKNQQNQPIQQIEKNSELDSNNNLDNNLNKKVIKKVVRKVVKKVTVKSENE